MPWELKILLGVELAEVGLQRLHLLEHIASALYPEPATAFAKVAVLESALYMRNQLLRDTDWAGMAHSLEIRVPLVDPRLLFTLAKIPAVQSNTANKQLLADSLSNPLPHTVINRAKSGFTTPVGQWQQRDKRLQAWQNIPSLAHKNCPWARRWSYAVMHNF